MLPHQHATRAAASNDESHEEGTARMGRPPRLDIDRVGKTAVRPHAKTRTRQGVRPAHTSPPGQQTTLHRGETHTHHDAKEKQTGPRKEDCGMNAERKADNVRGGMTSARDAAVPGRILLGRGGSSSDAPTRPTLLSVADVLALPLHSMASDWFAGKTNNVA